MCICVHCVGMPTLAYEIPRHLGEEPGDGGALEGEGVQQRYDAT